MGRTRVKRRQRKQMEKKKKIYFCDLLKENHVTSFSDAQNSNNPWVRYSHNIPPIIKMLNQTMTQRGTQEIGLGILIGRCFPDCQHERLECNPKNKTKEHVGTKGNRNREK